MHTFEDVRSILFRANQALATLERYRTRLDQVTTQLSLAELDDVVMLRDVLYVLQRSVMGQKIADEIEAYVAELGTDGRLLELQLDELMSSNDNWSCVTISPFGDANSRRRYGI
jgi:diadenylate cyclase